MEISLLEVWEALGLEEPRGRQARCPLPDHDDRTPSASFDEVKGLWFCFSCCKGGDAFTLIEEVEGLSFKEAKARIENLTGRSVESDRSSGPAYLGGRRKKRAYRPPWL